MFMRSRQSNFLALVALGHICAFASASQGAEAASRQPRYGTTHRVFAEIPANFPYPKELKRRDLSAEAELHLRRDGTVAEVVFTQSSGFTILDQTAAKGFKRWKFPRPNQYDIVRIPVTFTIRHIRPEDTLPGGIESRRSP